MSSRGWVETYYNASTDNIKNTANPQIARRATEKQESQEIEAAKTKAIGALPDDEAPSRQSELFSFDEESYNSNSEKKKRKKGNPFRF